MEGVLPASPPSTGTAMLESVRSSAQDVPILGEWSCPSSLALEEKVFGGADENNRECTPDPDRVNSVSKTMLSGNDVDLGNSVEASPNSADSSPHSTETPVIATNSGEGCDLDEPVQPICRSSRQRQLPDRLQYTKL